MTAGKSNGPDGDRFLARRGDVLRERAVEIHEPDLACVVLQVAAPPFVAYNQVGRIGLQRGTQELNVRSQVITATFVDGMLKPDEELGLAAGTKVRLILDLPDDRRKQREAACAELDRLCDESPIESHGPRLTRDQLHERR